jgi:hypothetical protein
MLILTHLLAATAGCSIGVLLMCVMHAAGQADDAALALREEVQRLRGIEPRGSVVRLVMPPKDAGSRSRRRGSTRR